MKYSAVFLTFLNNFKSILLLTAWGVALGVSTDAQESKTGSSLIDDLEVRFARLELQPLVKEPNQFIDTHTSFSVANSRSPLDVDEPSIRRFEQPADSAFEGFNFKTQINDNEDISADDPPRSNKFHWRSAISQSLIVLGIQHGYALVAQEKTRSAVANGNFFGDYWRSVKAIKGWDDGNRFATNYIAHPMQGGLTGFIFVQNHDRVKAQKFGESKQYWKDRFTAFVWSTAWSTQFELGPISQSSIGNVGMYGNMGYVDLVLTPTVGTAWLIAEEALDRYVVRHIESQSFMIMALARMFLNPMRTVANLLRFREPWYRDRPFGH